MVPASASSSKNNNGQCRGRKNRGNREGNGTKDGKTVTVYEAEVKKPGGEKVEIKVDEDGRLIELKDG